MLSFAPAVAMAASPDYTVTASFVSDAQTGANTVGGGQGKSVPSVVATIVNVLSIVVGMVAVIMIIVSGLKYVTSSGDSNKVGSAKSTLTAALIGVAIAALAQFLVHFVIVKASG